MEHKDIRVMMREREHNIPAKEAAQLRTQKYVRGEQWKKKLIKKVSSLLLFDGLDAFH